MYTKDNEQRWKNEWGGGDLIFSILIKNKLDFEITKKITDSNGRLILKKANIRNVPYVLANIYAPNNKCVAVDFFEKMHSVLISENISANDNIILAGDFNAALNPLLDRNANSCAPNDLPLIQRIYKIMSFLKIFIE